MKRVRIRSARYVLAILLGSTLLAALPDLCVAQPYDVPPTWGGNFWDRPRLTGSWWGLRDEIGKKGVVLDADILLSPQGVMSGGKDTGWNFWGNADYTLNIDTGKLGLWPGGFFKFYGDSSFGDSVQGKTGAIVPVNTFLLLPNIDQEPASALMNATFTQFLSPKFGLFAGKVFTLDGFKGEFTGDIRNQFMYTALAFPMAADLIVISGYGGGVVALPWEGVILTAMALDASGTPTNNDISDAFDDGAMVIASGQVAIKPFGLVGHQNVGGYWSNKTRISLVQDPSNVANFLLKERFPLLGESGPHSPAGFSSGSPPISSTRCDPRTARTPPGPCSTASTSTSGSPPVTRSAASGCSSTSAPPTGIRARSSTAMRPESGATG